MSTEPESFLARWSRRKRVAEEAKRSDSAVPQPPAAPPKAADEPVAAAATSAAATAASSAPAHDSGATTEVPLPPIESLDGLRSDYQAFFQQPVAEELRHAALKKLFADPHFNQMDMLDVYVDDYTQFEPLSAALRVRLPSARDFLSAAERAELEAAEERAGAPADMLQAPEADRAAASEPFADAAPGREHTDDAGNASADSTPGPAAATTDASAASEAAATSPDASPARAFAGTQASGT
jgi:hypothetical protein